MSFILKLVTSSAVFFPTNVTITAFDTKVHCEQALIEAKKQWQTVSHESKCIDLEKEAEIRAVQEKLKELKAEP